MSHIVKIAKDMRNIYLVVIFTLLLIMSYVICITNH